MKTPVPNSSLFMDTPLKLVLPGSAASPAPVIAGLACPKTDNGVRIVATIRRLIVARIACRFIGFFLTGVG
jgi:hypothetical protein